MDEIHGPVFAIILYVVHKCSVHYLFVFERNKKPLHSKTTLSGARLI